MPPAATALAFVRYALDLPSLEVAHALRERASVLVGAGAHFGVENHLRITHGLAPAYLDQALSEFWKRLVVRRYVLIQYHNELGDDVVAA